MRSLIRRFDAFLSRRYGVFTFTDEEDCLLRLQIAAASHSLLLPGQVVQPGDKVLKIHLWNEHVPIPSSSEGYGLVWAKEVQRMFLKSLQAVGRYMQGTSSLADTRAVGGETILLFAGDRRNGERLMKRLGFKVLPYTHPLGRFGEFWENFYSWVLVWTYNPAGLHHRSLFHQRRSEFWISAGDYLARYGQKAVSLHQGNPPF